MDEIVIFVDSGVLTVYRKKGLDACVTIIDNDYNDTVAEEEARELNQLFLKVQDDYEVIA